MNPASLFLRAFQSDLRRVAVSDAERSTLQQKGINEPRIQQYLAWRRGVFVMVVVPTLLSALLATVNEWVGADSGRLWEGLGDHLSMPADDDEDEDEPAPAKPAKPTTFATLAEHLHTATLYAMPLAALLAAFCWNRYRLSSTFLVVAWGFAFVVPILLALCPWSWWGEIAPPKAATPAERYEYIAEGIKEGISYFIMLMPTVLSLVPGVQRACLRIKSLLPESMLPGWFLISAAPFCALLFLVTFVALNQVASNPLFLAGMFLWLAAPLVYVWQADVVTRPLVKDDDQRDLKRTQKIVAVMMVSAITLLVIYLLSQEIFGMRLIGLDPKKSLLRPMDLVEYFLEYIGRSMFITALSADLIMWMNARMWQHTKEFVGTPAAAQYDQVVSGLGGLRSER